MKCFFKKIVCIIFAMVLLLGDVFSVSASTSGTKMIGGVDYSGKGTVINGETVIGKTATIGGNYVNVPVYKGKYVAGAYDYWWTKPWSGWSTANYKRNADFTVYNGSQKATEYQVESRKEYQYKRVEKQAVYSTKYYTTYKGTKWYNRWSTITASSWTKYPGAKANYKIVRRYTKIEKSGTKNVTVYNGTWRTSAPARNGGNAWSISNTRTTYRYRSRTLTWNAKAMTTTESTPLNYSLYDQNGKPLFYGIKVTANPDISNHCKTGIFNSNVLDYNYTTTYFYFPTNTLKNQLEMALLKSNATDETTLYIKNNLQNTSLGITTILGLAAQKFSESAVLAAIGKATTYTTAAIVPFILVNNCLQTQKQVEFNDFIKELEELDDYKIYSVEFTKYINTSSTQFQLPQYFMETALIDAKSTSKDDVSFVSMCINNNKKLNKGIDVVYEDFNIEYFGEVSYVKSFDEYEKYLSTYFSSYDTFDILSWINL